MKEAEPATKGENVSTSRPSNSKKALTASGKGGGGKREAGTQKYSLKTRQNKVNVNPYSTRRREGVEKKRLGGKDK